LKKVVHGTGFHRIYGIGCVAYEGFLPNDGNAWQQNFNKYKALVVNYSMPGSIDATPFFLCIVIWHWRPPMDGQHGKIYRMAAVPIIF
jgi:hypothetical protein